MTENTVIIDLDILLLNDLLNDGVIDRGLYNTALQKLKASNERG